MKEEEERGEIIPEGAYKRAMENKVEDREGEVETQPAWFHLIMPFIKIKLGIIIQVKLLPDGGFRIG